MPLTPEQVQGLGVALNEADWHDVRTAGDTGDTGDTGDPGDTVSVLLTVLARDDSGAEVADPRRTLRLAGCSRLVASYRGGTWDDDTAPVTPLDLTGLREVLRRHGGTPVYGWEFVDLPDRSWVERLSLDLDLGGPGGHDLTLFQDIRGEAHLDFKVWFADLAVLDGAGARMDLARVLAEGRRWWDAMYAGQRSDRAPGIAALAPARGSWRDRFRRTAR